MSVRRFFIIFFFTFSRIKAIIMKQKPTFIHQVNLFGSQSGFHQFLPYCLLHKYKKKAKCFIHICDLLRLRLRLRFFPMRWIRIAITIVKTGAQLILGTNGNHNRVFNRVRCEWAQNEWILQCNCLKELNEGLFNNTNICGTRVENCVEEVTCRHVTWIQFSSKYFHLN